jgi:hypothetical protein
MGWRQEETTGYNGKYLEALVAWLKILSQNLRGMTEKSHKNITG